MGPRDNEPILDGPSYWYTTAGEDLKRMLQLAGTPEVAQASFMSFFRHVLCPALGEKGRGDPAQEGSMVGWDGSPFEYSFEFKGSTKSPGVRFVADVTRHRPVDDEKPLGNMNVRQIVDYLAKRTPGFDTTWDRAFEQCFTCEHLPAAEQHALIAQLGFHTPMILGFDVKPKIMLDQHGPEQGEIVPVMLKSYYAPHYAVAARNLPGNWEAITSSIRQLPSLNETSPNLLKGPETLEAYLSDKQHYRKAARFMSTDFITPGKARLKIYMRYDGDDFDEIWDYYTLGGRIPDLDDDKPMLRDLIEMACGRYKLQLPRNTVRQTKVTSKPVAFYFSLTPDKPYPTSKVYYPPARKAPSDLVVARGVDEWLGKYGWNTGGGMAIEERVQSVL